MTARNLYGSPFKLAFEKLHSATLLPPLETSPNVVTSSVLASASLLLSEHVATDDSSYNTPFHARLRALACSDYPPVPDDHAFTLPEIEHALFQGNLRSAPGLDGLTGMFVGNLFRIHPSFFLLLFNAALRLGHFPTPWKEGRIIFIPKPGRPPHLPSAYRPIVMNSLFGKVLERLLNSRLYFFLNSNHLLHDSQFGFTHARSASLALYVLKQRLLSLKASKTPAVLISLDFQGAFDTVWHAAVLFFLRRHRCPANLYHLLCSFLSGRRVVFRRARVKLRHVSYDTLLIPVQPYKKTVPACGRCGSVGQRPDACPGSKPDLCGICGKAVPLTDGTDAPHECTPRCALCCKECYRAPPPKSPNPPPEGPAGPKKRKRRRPRKPRKTGPRASPQRAKPPATNPTPPPHPDAGAIGSSLKSTARQVSHASPKPHLPSPEPKPTAQGDFSWATRVRQGPQVSGSGGAASPPPPSTIPHPKPPTPPTPARDQIAICQLQAQVASLTQAVVALANLLPSPNATTSGQAPEAVDSAPSEHRDTKAPLAPIEARVSSLEAHVASTKTTMEDRLAAALQTVVDRIPGMIVAQLPQHAFSTPPDRAAEPLWTSMLSWRPPKFLAPTMAGYGSRSHRGRANSDPITILQCNCRGPKARTKRDALRLHLETYSHLPAVVALQETGEHAALRNYKCTKGMRKPHYACIEITPPIRRQDPSIRILNIYSSPKQPHVTYADVFSKVQTVAAREPLVIVGGFNAPSPQWGFPHQGYATWSQHLVTSLHQSKQTVQLSEATLAVDNHLLHLWEARHSLFRRWRRQKHNRQLKIHIAALTQEADEYVAQLADSNWVECCNTAAKQMSNRNMGRDADKLAQAPRDRYLCNQHDPLGLAYSYAGSEYAYMDRCFQLQDLKAAQSKMKRETAPGRDRIHYKGPKQYKEEKIEIERQDPDTGEEQRGQTGGLGRETFHRR
ncbi:hypothetical protein HPB49_026442 [Dermacentor silvarum]|nr:hypothetical protein HPB49_026442 [Dermacentor silvarum]